MGTHFLKFCRLKLNARSLPTLFCAVLFFSLISLSAGSAFAQTKSLKLYYIHTGEKATITYKKNGRYIASGLKKVNWHLRDWRRNEPTKMDPKLLDLVWEAYRRSGSKAYITVISGYRSPASNNLLRKRGRGVAKNSQHTLGKALDFYLPDVKLSKLRAIGLKMEVGGVGYYPRSGSPFVHFDVGRVRHWPRMSRKELVRVFPKGNTMHVPSDGKPLARYEQAVASYKRRSASGKLVPESKPTKKELNLFQRLARNTKDDEADDAGNDVVAAPRAVSTTVKTTAPKPSPKTPEPAETLVAARETEFAALPASIPVPILAPRQNAVATGEIIEVAVLPTPVENPVVPEPVIEEPPVADTAEIEQPLEEEAILASVPVPAKRPNVEALLAAVEEQLADPVEEPTSVLALSEPEPTETTDNIQVAALTPSEIEDLRALARPSIPVTPLRAPTPAIAIGETPSTAKAEVENVGEPQPETPQTAEIVVAALEPIKEPVIEPAPEILAPIPLEPGIRTTGTIVIPEQNPIVKETIEIAAITPVEEIIEALPDTTEIQAPTVSASLPIPTRRPVTEIPETIVVASVDEEIITPQTPEQNPVAEQLPKRTISLDEYSAPQNNTSSLGQWALASETTIQEFAEVQAPAYGRNIIRQVPGTILVQGFNLTPFGPGQNNFKGKAVTAMRFARLDLK